MATGQQVSLISRWFVKPGCADAALAALTEAAEQVWASEPGTLTYRVHVERAGNDLQSLPPVDPLSILFFEVYRDAQAFKDHLDGPVFTGFVRDHGDLFLPIGGKPYTTVDFLSLHAGFTRSEDAAAKSAATGPAETAEANSHPAVMFEIIANDPREMASFYTQVFGWQYQLGSGGFAYVHFPAGTPPLLGGIGQAQPNTPGFTAGSNFYLLVDSIEPFLERATLAGATPLMMPTVIDGYRFAMFSDPEENAIGLIEPFSG
jgi:predicted enzyme related to lactoylglutathione lyase/quinol monooxygenase YgiN